VPSYAQATVHWFRWALSLSVPSGVRWNHKGSLAPLTHHDCSFRQVQWTRCVDR
jgi:hypothetical protein